jgi:hypothetical protein
MLPIEPLDFTSRLLKNNGIQPFFTYRRDFSIPDGI